MRSDTTTDGVEHPGELIERARRTAPDVGQQQGGDISTDRQHGGEGPEEARSAEVDREEHRRTEVHRRLWEASALAEGTHGGKPDHHQPGTEHHALGPVHDTPVTRTPICTSAPTPAPSARSLRWS